MQYIFIYIAIMNIIEFVIFGIDKRKAIKSLWRIPEKTLIAFAVIGGGVAMAVGMKVFHHKTKKTLFRVMAPVSIIFNALVFGGAIYLLYF